MPTKRVAVAPGLSLQLVPARAKAEKNLVLWGGGPAANYERAARAFEQKYPGITVSVEGGTSNVFNRRIEVVVENLGAI
jgi:hypothetical protein